MKKLSTRKKEFEKKISEYRKFLKDDYDWDGEYILRFLQYKLERTRKCIVSNNIVEGASKIGQQIKQVEALLGRVLENRYYDDISKDFHRKYGRPKMITGQTEKGARSMPVIFKYTHETPENRRRIRQEDFKLHQQAERLRDRDLKKAFDLLYKNIWNWWD